jgi:putative radical SAM enzyme (TIGR03279 family)
VVGSAPPREGLFIEAVAAGAERHGVRPGDRLLTIDGEAPEDVLDLEMAAAEGRFVLVLERRGRPLSIEVELRRGEPHGLALWNGLGAATRLCGNACSFCFVDQVPAGLRRSLAVKDDDYRLSFLSGNFITLANMSAHDLERVERLRLSPLYVSLHAWDDGVRVGLMGTAARDTRQKLIRLAAAGVGLHVQVVLCPGVNDGSVLVETLSELSAVPAVTDVGVVPVSLAEEGRLRRVTAADAEAVIAEVERLQEVCSERFGRNFAQAADELYLLAGRLPPPSDAPFQYENGIGVAADFIREAGEVRVPPGARLALLGGVLAERPLEAAAQLMNRAVSTGETSDGVRPFIVANQVFGSHVTVTGLLGGREVVRRLGEQRLAAGEWLLAPRCFLPRDVGMTVDDLDEAALRAACDGRFALGETLGEAIAKVTPTMAG